MKKLLLAFFLFIGLNMYSQTDGMIYQAVILNPNLQLPGVNDTQNVYPYKELNIKFTILNHAGAIEYQEIQSTTTDKYGMINVIIGSGEPVVGHYTQIKWYGKPKNLKVEINLDGNYKELSTQAILFTPVAYHRDILATGFMTIDGVTNLNDDLTVNNAAPTLLTGTLDVLGHTTFAGALTVGGVTDLNAALNVNNGAPTHLSGNLVVDGTTNLNSSLSVNNAAPTLLTGTLNVTGITNINNNFTVTNASPTNLSGLLNVTGVTTLNNNFTVANGSPSHLSGNLVVDGTTNLNSSLTVNNGSPTSLSGTLNVTGASTFQGPMQTHGQVTIDAALPQGESNYDYYPLRVQGSAQGIAVKLTAGTPTNSNNFITFFDANGSAVGRIEGETTSEVVNDPEFIVQNAIYIAEEIKAGVNQGTSFIPVVVGGVGVSSGPCGACIAAAAADLVLATANLVSYNVFALDNLGVTYQSGSADYAEWLERNNPSERVMPGDIVGVYAGKISKNTKNAQQFLVISTKPAMLGNMPEKEKQDLYSKVAFMGQIPVKVKGVVLAGDYILPSGNNDGIGIAVSQNEITAKQYKEIIGVAWSSVLMNSDTYSMVNMAIGLNSNDVAQLAEKQESRIAELEQKNKSFEDRLLALERGEKLVSKPEAVEKKDNIASKGISKDQQILASMPAELSDEAMKDAFAYLTNMYKEKGIDVSKNPGLNRLFNDVAFKNEVIRKAKETYRLSYDEIRGRVGR
jgi:hypothetical protein